MFYLCVQQMVELLLNLENTMLLPQDHFGSAVGQIVSFPYPLQKESLKIQVPNFLISEIYTLF